MTYVQEIKCQTLIRRKYTMKYKTEPKQNNFQHIGPDIKHDICSYRMELCEEIHATIELQCFLVQ